MPGSAGAVQFVPNTPVVIIDYNDLVKGLDLSQSFQTAYGFDGLGLLVVKNVPKFVEYRKRLLPLAHKFANLPENIKNKYESAECQYQFGWSHGKENLDGMPDFSKGSYYNNPTHDRPIEDEEIIKKWPSFAFPNIWPKEDLPELEHAFKDLGGLIVDTGKLLAKHLDAFVHNREPTYPVDRLQKVMETGICAKARLLHYFPIDQARAAKPHDAKEDYLDYSTWCGWHNDHGSLTGLTCAMYMTQDGTEVPCPDASAGLYVKSRKGDLIKAVIPADCLAYQMGETEQVHSGGILQATPHCVRGAMGPDAVGISRETFAVFMEPLWDEPMNIPNGRKPEDACLGSSHKFLPKGVPPLDRRWDASWDFGKFTVKTLDAYTVQ